MVELFSFPSAWAHSSLLLKQNVLRDYVTVLWLISATYEVSGHGTERARMLEFEKRDTNLTADERGMARDRILEER